MDIEEIIKLYLEEYPETRGNNDLLWVEVSKLLCDLHNITTLDGFFNSILNRKIPTSHSVASHLTKIRRDHPELKPSPEQMKRKLKVQKSIIDKYRKH